MSLPLIVIVMSTCTWFSLYHYVFPQSYFQNSKLKIPNTPQTVSIPRHNEIKHSKKWNDKLRFLFVSYLEKYESEQRQLQHNAACIIQSRVRLCEIKTIVKLKKNLVRVINSDTEIDKRLQLDSNRESLASTSNT